MRSLVLGAAAAALCLVGCRDSTGPTERIHEELFGFETPASARFTDTVRVAFRYFARCGPAPSLDLSMRGGRLTVAVWTTRDALDRICPAIYPQPVRTEVLIPPQFLGSVQTEVRFRQPEGADSVRTIATEGVAVR